MSFVRIATKYNGPLEAAHVSIDEDRCDVAERLWRCCPAQGPNWTFQISIVNKYVGRLKAAPTNLGNL